MINKRKLILPGDKGFNDRIIYPWDKIRYRAGLRRPANINLEIHGYFVKDCRILPPTAIFKNCKFILKANTFPNLDEEPVPFTALGEAYSYIKSLNLSSSEERKFRIAALSPDPGLGQPMPDTLFATMDELKK